MEPEYVSGWPVYCGTNETLDRTQIFRIILMKDVPRELVSAKVPSAVKQSAVFVVDLKCVKNRKDLTVDDNGAWTGGHSCPTVKVRVIKDENEIFEVESVATGSKKSDDQYSYKRQYRLFLGNKNEAAERVWN